MARWSSNRRRLKVTRELLIIAIALLLLLGQLAVSLSLMALSIMASVILYPIDRSWGEAALRLPTVINAAMNRFRQRLAGSPRSLRFSNPR